VDEKSIQVTMMDRIYSRADYVVAWLGPDDQYSGSGLKALSTLASHMSQFTQSNIIPYKGTDSLNYEEAGIPIISPDEWTGLASLYKRQWCRRCWIIQEAVLPKLLLMYCGSHYISMDDLGAVASAIRQNETKLNTRDSVQYVPVNEAALPAEWNMIDVSTWRAELQAARETDAAEERARICEKSFTLPALVRNSWTFLASDARDKIYSLHGLINVFAPNKAEADYRQSIASVFTAAARQIIKQDGRLQIILTCIGLGQPRLDGLPSWVPDFSYPVSNAVPLVFRADAGLEYLEQGMGPPYSPVLHVQGLRVGKVTQVSDRLDPGPYRKFRMDASWLKMAASLRRNDSSGDGKTDLAYEAAAPLSDALWRTLCMNMTASSFADPSHYTEKPPPEFREEFHHLILLLICAGGDEKLLESVGLVNDQEIASTTIIHRARDALEDLAPVLDALDAINQHDGDQCVVPRRAYVERMWHDLIFTVRRVASAPANGQPIDFYPTPELKSGVDRLVGQGFVNASSGLFGMCKGFARAFSMAYSGRQLVTVDDRHLALAPLSARVGDEVWIIAGLSAPAVLRTATQSPGEHQAVADDLAELSIEDRGPARYEFVGGAYVHALMHGEAAKIWGTELQDIAMV
jgi:hypothetical protein